MKKKCMKKNTNVACLTVFEKQLGMNRAHHYSGDHIRNGKQRKRRRKRPVKTFK